MPVGPEDASDRDDVEAKTADLGLSEKKGLVTWYGKFRVVDRPSGQATFLSK